MGVKGIKRLNEQGEEGQGTLNSRQHVGWQGREGVGATSIMAKMPAWPQSLDRTHTREGKKYRTRRYLKAYNLLLSNSLTLLTVLSFLVSQQLPC